MNSKERAKLIKQQEEKLKALSKQLQKSLFAAVVKAMRRDLTISRGIIVNSSENINAVSASNSILEQWRGIVGSQVVKFFASELKELQAQNASYFNSFDAPNFDGIKKIVNSKMLNVSKMFLQNYLLDEAPAMQLKQLVVSAAQNGVSFADLQKQLLTEIDGTPEKLGLVENYNTVATRLQDVFSDYDRLMQNEYATQLQLNYAVYQGGVIGTTRDFCDERNGGVYTREEILAWQNEDWQGKKKNHNILTDGGGYNCRHYYDWVSYETAKRLRPDIDKSVYDIPR